MDFLKKTQRVGKLSPLTNRRMQRLPRYLPIHDLDVFPLMHQRAPIRLSILSHETAIGDLIPAPLHFPSMPGLVLSFCAIGRRRGGRLFCEGRQRGGMSTEASRTVSCRVVCEEAERKGVVGW
jgi:hypothetical protein